MTDYELICINGTKVFSFYLGKPIGKNTPNETYFKCHLCDSNKLSVNITKGVAHCWVCGWSGNPVTLIQEIENLTVKNAVAKGLDILNKHSTYLKHIPKLPKITDNKIPDELKSLKESIYLMVYSYLLKNMSSEKNKIIDNIFNKIPDDYKQNIDVVVSDYGDKIADEVLKYFPENIVEACPGFIKINGKTKFSLNNHIIFPYWSSDRTTILGFNGRTKIDKEGFPRYRWLVGEQKHLYYPLSVTDENFSIITEGEKKAIVATANGFPTIAVAGVECYNTPELKKMHLENREIFICYDRDKENSGVLKAEAKLLKVLLNKKAEAKVIDLPEGYKLDDFIYEFGPNLFYRILQQKREE